MAISGPTSGHKLSLWRWSDSNFKNLVSISSIGSAIAVTYSSFRSEFLVMRKLQQFLFQATIYWTKLYDASLSYDSTLWEMFCCKYETFWEASERKMNQFALQLLLHDDGINLGTIYVVWLILIYHLIFNRSVESLKCFWKRYHAGWAFRWIERSLLTPILTCSPCDMC